MAPKAKAAEVELELEGDEEEAPAEPAEPEIAKKCFRAGSQAYYGDVKVGYGARQGTFVRHGFGRQVNSAVTPALKKNGSGALFETAVMSVYEGNWEEDMMSGHGVYSWADGSSYDGAFVNGEMHGPGRFLWPDGSVYEGTWHKGQMSGHGRFDSRFDGSFLQGRFHRDCFQHTSGRWIDVLEQNRQTEIKQFLQGDTSGLVVRRCAFGQASAEQIQRLEETLVTTQNEGLVPFVIVDESLRHTTALSCLTSAKLAAHKTQTVSVRLAAIAKRRFRDYQNMFYEAIRKSLQTGSLFVLAFEDDDDGCGMVGQEDDRWFTREPKRGPPSRPLPDEWQLSYFFDPNSFLPEILQPKLFNGRVKAKLFVPEELLEDDRGGVQVLAESATPLQAASPDVAEGEVAAEEAGDKAKSVTAAEDAAAPAPTGAVGPTGHVFKLPGVADPRAVGLRPVHHLRPALLATSSLPASLSNADICSTMVERFSKHIPLHRTAVVVLTHDSIVEPELA
mmetsp:Transcript_80870/g.140488  ORF Transcript_80870/g.140488 Transcript_80870/m.140488 type:complete len:505 (-) Transcript_80870:73-1587(-)